MKKINWRTCRFRHISRRKFCSLSLFLRRRSLLYKNRRMAKCQLPKQITEEIHDLYLQASGL